MSNGFTVTPSQVLDQVAEGSATTLNGECLIWIDSNMRVITEVGTSTAQQAIGYLDRGEWAPMYPTCGTPGCLVLAHLTDSPAKVQAVKDEEILALVERTAVSLADLYRKAKSRGQLGSQSAYGG